MHASLPPLNLTAAQRELWQRVNELWALSAQKDALRIRDALHPEYMGWDMSAPLPHDREAAIHSVTGDSPTLASYHLEPLSVRVYQGSVGVAHYRYQATVAPQDGSQVQVTGSWTEVYTKQGNRWLLVAVSGRPDASSGAHARGALT